LLQTHCLARPRDHMGLLVNTTGLATSVTRSQMSRSLLAFITDAINRVTIK
jgi:hypothetical protein